MKPITFLGDSLARVREFPERVRRQTGMELRRVQFGLEPSDWKPLKGVGMGVREIRIRDAAGAFRVIYVANFSEAVYVLHAFQKKTRSTSQRDLDLAALRLALLK
jgi:phage-related protein